jgi:hypothetical protein
MKPRTKAILFILTSAIIFTAASSGSRVESNVVLVGSTPGGSAIKAMLRIDPEKNIDFIRWHITLAPTTTQSGHFKMELNFGVSQPNTSGFVGGGEHRSIAGQYSMRGRNDNGKGSEVLQLRDQEGNPMLSLRKLNDQIYHVLTTDDKFMVGNGGWSYSLNTKTQRSQTLVSTFSKSFTSSQTVERDTTRMAVYDGRTPCREFSQYYDFALGDECFKLKWRLMLSRDPHTHKPTTYTVKMVEPIPDPNSPVDHTYREKSGTWRIQPVSSPQVLIFELTPDGSMPPLYLLAGDENVLFLLDKDNRLLTGNEDFSYTFNRKGAE